MDGYLRQSTASQSRLIGPFIDDTDFKTAETGLTIANTDVKLRANGTTLANKNSGGGTHEVNGMYSLTWDATDTANVGELKYSVKVAGALQVFGSYVVLEEAVYDALFASTATGIASGVALEATSQSILTDTAEIGAAGAGLTNINLPNQTMDITGNITGNLSGSVGSVTGLTPSTIADQVWDELIAGHLGAGSTGEALDGASAPSANDNADALLDRADAIEVGLTPRGALRLTAASVAGKLSGASTSAVFRNAVADSKDRITATVDPATGNRTAVTTDTT